MARIADDVRLIASGPRLGLGEISLPSLQPGSSMMPGKVNPVIPEMVCQVASQIIGNDTVVSLSARAGHLELNTHLPVIVSNVLESIEIAAAAANAFADKCIKGITANQEKCRSNVERSLAMVTMLAPKLGYSKAALIAKKAHETGKSVREIVIEEGILNESEVDHVFDLGKISGN
jgi:fumarate hydratase class II